MSDKETDLIELTGLWVNTAKSGMKYFSGKINNLNVLIFKNQKKEEGSKQPDYRMFLSKPKKKEQPASEDMPL